MKALLLLPLLMFLPESSRAGQLLWVDSSTVTSYTHRYGDCDTFVLGTKDGKFTFRACGGQVIVEGDMNELLTSPRTEQCIKWEECIGQRCTRQFGVHRTTTKLLLVLEGSKIDSYKVKTEITACE